jgi:hypothetical protein
MMSTHDSFKSKAVSLPKGCQIRKDKSGKRYARKGEQFWRESKKHKGKWREIDDFRTCQGLRAFWDEKPEAEDTEADDSAEADSGSKSAGSKKKRRKGFRSDCLTETGKDSHGRNWYYDDPKKRTQRYYFILGLSKNKDTGCVTAELITTGRRATHLLGKKEMELLVKQVTKVYTKCYGKRALKKLIYPS